MKVEMAKAEEEAFSADPLLKVAETMLERAKEMRQQSEQPALAYDWVAAEQAKINDPKDTRLTLEVGLIKHYRSITHVIALLADPKSAQLVRHCLDSDAEFREGYTRVLRAIKPDVFEGGRANPEKLWDVLSKNLPQLNPSVQKQIQKTQKRINAPDFVVEGLKVDAEISTDLRLSEAYLASRMPQKLRALREKLNHLKWQLANGQRS